MVLLGALVQDLVVQHTVRRRDTKGKRGVRRREWGLVRRVLALLHGGVWVHLHGRRGCELKGHMRANVRGRDEVLLCGGL